MISSAQKRSLIGFPFFGQTSKEIVAAMVHLASMKGLVLGVTSKTALNIRITIFGMYLAQPSDDSPRRHLPRKKRLLTYLIDYCLASQ
jgi:hypothetical protein